MLEEALLSGAEIAAVIIRDGEPIPGGLPDTRVALVTQAVINAVCNTRTPQGIAAMVRLPETKLEGGKRLVMLCGVQDPGNVGTIWRTAEAAGFDGIVLSPDSADPFGDKVQRSTMGSVFRLGVVVRDISCALCELSDKGYTHYASEVSGKANDVFSWRQGFNEPLTLVIGGEARGIPQDVLSLCHHRLYIPMRGKTESLNAAIAAGILMYRITYGAI